jgi:hypothetical protein
MVETGKSRLKQRHHDNESRQQLAGRPSMTDFPGVSVATSKLKALDDMNAKTFDRM